MRRLNKFRSSNDLTTNSTADTFADMRSPIVNDGNMPTSANTGTDPILTARFASVEAAEKAYDFIVKDNPADAVMVSAGNPREENFYDDISALRSAIEKDGAAYQYIGLGVHPEDEEDRQMIKNVWAGYGAEFPPK